MSKIIGPVFVGVICMILLWGCSGTQKTRNVDMPPVGGVSGTAEEKEYDTKTIAVVKEIDGEKKIITLFSTESNRELTLEYTGATDIMNQYEQILSISQIDIGEMVDAYYIKDTNKLVGLQISNDAWEYKGVRNLKVDSSSSVMEISEQKYQFGNDIVLADGNNIIDIIDINEKDQLTVKGIGGRIYSILVTKGHGYIRLKNYESFVGGTIEVGYGIMEPIVENMLLVAPEGTYKLVVENGELRGMKNITVVRNEETSVSMGEYQSESNRVGTVSFKVNPEGAGVYINGSLIDDSQSLKMNYGKHKIRVSLTGYEDYLGYLYVANERQTILINLAESSAKVEVEEEETQEEESNTTVEEVEPQEQQEQETTQEEKKVLLDSEHNIYINTPEGAEVYLNGKYKGIVPLSFTKEIGTHTITLSKDEFITKSYTLDIVDDKKDVTYQFNSLKRKEE